jgi:hypothetical protein
MLGIKHFFRDFSSGAQTATTLVTPASGQRIRVYGYVVSTGGANNVTLILSDADRVNDTTNFAKFYFAANGGANLSPGSAPIAEGNVDAPLSVTSSASTTLSISLWYMEAP